MCGISGIVDFGNIESESLQRVKRMNQRLIHRGPDAEGYYSDDSVAFGHRRLSIIDIDEKSNQPMFDAERDVMIVFNGEIYNHQELREELETEYQFNTDHSDTEVLLNAYKKWGIDCLQRFTGMFAFALYDSVRKKVYLCRDRLGKKPLYYARIGSAVIFASEANALFAHGKLTKKLNPKAIYDYLSYLTVSAPDTFFEDVYKLPAGNYIELTPEGAVERVYWDIADYINRKVSDKGEVLEKKTESFLLQSMRYRCVSDVPIAVALSGGLDSSLNLFHAKNNTNGDVVAINVSYEIKSEYDESEIARKFSQDQGVKFISKRIDQHEYESWIREYFEFQSDTPIGDPNSPLLYGISKVAAENGCKVLQVGEGGDEIGGYPVYESLRKLNSMTRFVPDWALRLANKVPLPNRLAREISVLESGRAEVRRFLFGFTEKEKRSFWKGPPQKNSFDRLKEFGKEITIVSDDSFLRKVLNIEYKMRLAELLLPRVDYPSMAASVEARAPFMDHRLVEYSVQIPFSEKMQSGSKTIIRAIAKKCLPAYLMSQPKVGFGMLLHPFLREDLPVWFMRDVVQVESPLKKFVSEYFLRSLYTEHMKNRSEGYRMWILYALNRWLEHHRDEISN